MTLEVPKGDKSYHWLLDWITRNASNSQHLSVVTTFSQAETGKVYTGFGFIPCPGVHFIWHKRNWIRIERTREKPMAQKEPFESVTLTCLGRDKSIYEDILVEAREIALRESEGKTIMYVPGAAAEWRQFGQPRKKRPISSVVLDEGISSKILTDVKEFIGNEKWYRDRGIPYRRGYLLYGPPGCGKSSYITALAGTSYLLALVVLGPVTWCTLYVFYSYFSGFFIERKRIIYISNHLQLTMLNKIIQCGVT